MSCAAILPFARVEQFAKKTWRICSTRAGGLALWNVHFRLADMTIAIRFAPVLELARGVTANQPLYGRDDRHLNNVLCTTAVYRRF